MYSIRTILILVLALGLRPASLQGATATPGPTSLGQLLQEGLASNPGLSAAKARWRAKIERYPQQIALPDLEIGFGYFVRPVETRLGSQEGVFSLKQPLPPRGLRGMRGKVVAYQIAIAELTYQIANRNLAGDIQRSYHELRYLEQAILISLRNLELYASIRARANAQYGQQMLPLQSLSKSHAGVLQLEYDILTLREQAQAERSQLSQLLGRRPPGRGPSQLAAVAAPAVTQSMLAKLYELSLQNQLELRRSQLAIPKLETQKVVRGLAQQPMTAVGLTYIRIADDAGPMSGAAGGRDAIMLNFGMKLPLWESKKRAERDEIAYLIVAAEAQYQAEQDGAIAKIDRLWAKLWAAQRATLLYRKTLRPQARAALGAAESANATSTTTSINELLELQAIYHNFQLAALRSETNYLKLLIDLEETVGLAVEDWPIPTGGHDEAE